MQRLGNWSLATLKQVARNALKLGARKRVVKVLRTSCIGGNKRQVYICLLSTRKLLFGVFGCLFKALKCHWVFAQVDAIVCIKLVGKPIDNALIPVVAAQVVVAVCCKYFYHAVSQVEQ